jgi:hypothetical protein
MKNDIEMEKVRRTLIGGFNSPTSMRFSADKSKALTDPKN